MGHQVLSNGHIQFQDRLDKPIGFKEMLQLREVIQLIQLLPIQGNFLRVLHQQAVWSTIAELIRLHGPFATIRVLL